MTTEQGAFKNLLLTPEARGSWKLTNEQSKSLTFDVPIDNAVRDWILGTSIPELARTWTPDSIQSHPQMLELTVQSIKQAFEHAISWTVGALVNLVNTHPLLIPTTPRLFAQTAWHIRHGVDTEQAITLLTSGITFRRLAHQIGRAAAEAGIRSGELRTWVADQQIAAIPAARHHAVLTLIDSGLDLTHHVEAGQLVTSVATAGL
ncbi:hypothetical protein [Streptomyces sp. NPDC055005]